MEVASGPADLKGRLRRVAETKVQAAVIGRKIGRLGEHGLGLAAAAWGILAVGDGAATLVGRAAARTRPGRAGFRRTDRDDRVPANRLPWNAEKTIAGTTAFFVFGALAGVGLAGWTRPALTPAPPLLFSLTAPIAAAASKLIR